MRFSAGLLLLGLVLARPGFAAVPPAVEYDIEVRVEPAAKRLHGSGKIHFFNGTPTPADRLCFHLYLNAFRNEGSSFMSELAAFGESTKRASDDAGFTEVLSLVRASDGADLLARAKYAAPDDGRADDRTVLEVMLDQAILPGQSVEVSISFLSQLPKPVARSGAHDGFMMAAQWFPKLGVFEIPNGGTDSAWNCHQYHALGEFYAPFGRYRVAIDVPQGHEVGATGVRVESKEAGGRARHVHQVERVHDFAFAVDPDLVRIERRYAGREAVDPARLQDAASRLGVSADELRPSDVNVILLIRPERRFAVERYFRASFHALTELSLRYGPYPYPVLTVIDPPRGAQETGGMEYPTLITGGSRWAVPAEMPVPESVTLHEIGHQFFYGLLGSDEVEEAWLDEGLTSYATLRNYELAYGGRLRFAPSLLGIPLTPWFVHSWSFRELERTRFLVSADQDPTVQPSWLFRDTNSYRVSVYARPVLFFLRLEQLLGTDALDRALYRYVQRHRYRAPRGRALLATIESEYGSQLPGWVTEPLFRAGALHLAVASLESERRPEPGGIEAVHVEGDVVSTSARTSSKSDGFRTRVVVERRGDLMRPTDLLITLEEGEVLRRHVDGPQRWWRFEHDGKRAVKAELFGPENDPLNATEIHRGRTREATSRPAIVFAAHAAFLCSLLLDLLGSIL